MKNKNLLKLITIVFIAIIEIFILNTKVHAAGIEGTTIVLNPRSWWRVDRLCKWKIWFS